MHHTGSKGDIGVARAIADLTEKGYDILFPVSSTSPFDLVAYKGGTFTRIQVKYITATNGVFIVSSFRKSIWNGRVRKARNTELDLICAFNPDTDKCYYLKPKDTPRSLRISETKNGYKTGIHKATDYTEIPE